MSSATSSVDSSGDETGLRDASLDTQPRGSEDGPPPPFPNIRETISVAALDASPNRQASLDTSCDNETGETAPTTTMSPRAYQLEMLEQSLKQNAIVVMDTGSGKTQVAVLRIKAELDRSDPDKKIWFLAPTVALCGQQFDVIRLQAASVPMRLLTGNDNVHTWSADIWDAILQDTRVVVSTYQVLLDALCHAFITIHQLSLIVFDEAHNCVGKHPGSKIMTDFYHRSKTSGRPLPSILGITATPSMTEDIQNIETLEAVLDAQCTSPTIHREELLKCVKRPEIRKVVYGSAPLAEYTKSMRTLQAAYLALDISQDPYILRLQEDPTERNRRALFKAIEKYDTYCQSQIKSLWGRSVEISQQLGSWAADLYLWKAASTFLDRHDDQEDMFETLSREEKRYLADFFCRLAIPRPTPRPQSGAEVSEKANALIKELVTVEENIVCIIFVRERATVSILCDLLASCPPIVEKHRIGSMVGASNYQNKRNAVYEFLSEVDQMVLQNFRSGKINVLVATSVLEEGIDVPACNMVICFDHPATPKAFIQRRGRARMKDSKLILLNEDSPDVVDRWEMLEEDMKLIYRDTERQIQQLEVLEDSEETSHTYFEVDDTGARLDFDNAKSHLEHFCRALSQGEFVDSRPDYIIHRHWDSTPPMLSCTVLLPSFVPQDQRSFDSQYSWLSEKNATKDAAFQAYSGLFNAGLVNHNLLPFKYEDIPGVEARAPEIDADALFDPWGHIAQAWKQGNNLWLYSLSFHHEATGQTEYQMLLPFQLHQIRPIQIYVNGHETCTINFGSRRRIMATEAASLRDHTSTLLALHYSHRWVVDDKAHVVRITVPGADVSMSGIGSKQFDFADNDIKEGHYFIRDESNSPFTYLGIVPSKPPPESIQTPIFDYDDAPSDVPYLVVKRWLKRSDFLHPVLAESSFISEKPYPKVIPLPWATVDSIPLKYAQFGMLIPSLIHELEVSLIAKELSSTVLQRIGISDLGLVREAISSRSAVEPVNYERLEFVGDSILKYLAAVQVSAMHPEWPEGYLSFFKDRLVSNSRLSRAAIDTGLARFILTKSFTGQKWRPLYLEKYLQGSPKPNQRRKLSTKTLADVVEALIGAAYVDGGVDKAQLCISTFVSDLDWHDVDSNRDVLFTMARDGDVLPPELKPLEDLVGYSFRKKSLLIEAMTHPSCLFDHDRRSYEHLEFLGDAILDYVVVTRMYSYKPPLAHHQMHLLKTAMVNGDFLAFISLDYSMQHFDTAVTSDLRIVERESRFSLWSFMRHSSEPIGVEQAATIGRYELLRDDIVHAMTEGDHYPWDLLARLQAKKFYSDVFESLLGAVWVDSGSIEACEALLERFGILASLDRLVKDQVQVQHPKEVIGKWAVTQTVTYEIDILEGTDGEKTFTCRVLVGDRVVAEVLDGVSKEEAKTKAAAEAVKVMTREKEQSKRASG